MFWESLSEPERAKLRQCSSVRSYAKGEFMFLEGQQADRVFIITSGEVRLTKSARDGKQVLLEIRDRGELLGELGVLDNKPRSATAIAQTPVTCHVISASRFTSLLPDEGALGNAVLLSVVARLRQSATRTRETGTTVARTRLASRLLERAELEGETNGQEISIRPNLSQEDWASWIGVTRDSVVASLHTLRSEGVVRTGRSRITVLDVERLRSYANS